MTIGKIHFLWMWPGWRAAIKPEFGPMDTYDDTETGIECLVPVPGSWSFEWMGLLVCYFGEEADDAGRTP